jgi:hypothetical protein
MIRSKQWCIQQRPEGGYFITQVLSSTQKTISFAPIVESETLDKKTYGGTINYTFTPEDYHLYTDTFPKLKPELLCLQVKKRFTDLGIAMDAAGLVHRSKELPGKAGVLNSLFIRQEDLANNLPQISSMTGIRKCKLIPAAASIAGLIQAVTDKAVLVFLIGTRFSHVLVVNNGVPIYNQSLAQTGPGQVEEALIPNAVDFARVTLRKDHDIDDFNIISLGPGRDTINLDTMGIEEWHPDFSQAVSTSQPEDILQYPHLFGAYFADPTYSFIPKDFEKSWLIQSVSRITAVGACIASVVLLAGWLYFRPILKEQHNQYQSMSAELDQQRVTIQDRMPQTTILNNFERLVNIRTKAKQESRLDVLAQQLSLALPEKVRITEFKIQRQKINEKNGLSMPPAAGPDPNATMPMAPEELSIPEKTQARAFTLSLTCKSVGNYTEVTTRFEKTATALNKRFGVENLTWTYREADKSGTIQCNLFPQPGGQTDEL